MKRREDREAFGLLSLLDLLACGLGAAMVLGFIMMLVRERPPVDASPSVGVLASFHVEDEDALFTFLIKPPRGRVVELGREDLEAGRVVDCGRQQGFECILLGWSRDGARHLSQLETDNGAPAKPGRSYLLFLKGPTPRNEDPNWELGVRYFNRQVEWASWFSTDRELPALSLKEVTVYSPAREEVKCEALENARYHLGDVQWCKVDVSEPQ